MAKLSCSLGTKNLEKRPRRGKNKKKDTLDWSCFEHQKHEIHPQRELQNVIKEIMYYDTSAPYQRDECWSQGAEINLIQSILRAIPIGAFHIVKKKNDSDFYYVLDAKQRLLAIKHFTENKFSVKYNGKEYKWSDLAEEENIQVLRKFQKFKVTVVEWEAMPLRLQRDLFEIINQSAGLNVAEKIYCPNFLARCLFKYIFNTCFKQLADNIRGEIRTDKRFSGIMWSHRICMLLLGKDLNDCFGVRTIAMPDLRESARELDTKLCNYFSDPLAQSQENNLDNLINDEVIEHIGLEIDFLKKLSDRILGCLNCRNNYDKKENAIDIMDFTCFVGSKIQKNIITFSQLTDNKKMFFEFYSNFVKLKSEKNLARHTTDLDSVNKRKDIFDELFDKLPIDKGYKNQKISESDKACALLEFDGICPVENRTILQEEIRFDHKYPKSKSSEVEVQILSNSANEMKSNLTRQNLEDLLPVT